VVVVVVVVVMVVVMAPSAVAAATAAMGWARGERGRVAEAVYMGSNSALTLSTLLSQREIKNRKPIEGVKMRVKMYATSDSETRGIL